MRESEGEVTAEQVLDALRRVIPEVGINVVDLGLTFAWSPG